MSCSVAIMAHPSRRKFVDQLTLALDRHAAVIWDHHDDRWETGRRALLQFDPNCSHHVIVQDDAIPCRRLIASIEKALEAIPEDAPASFYIGRIRPHRQTVTAAVERAIDQDRRWFIHEGPWWGVTIALPTAHIEELVEWCDGRPDIDNYDRRISRAYGHLGIKCWYSIPSLVEHRPVRENPSLIHGRVGNRQAHYFIGTNRSGLDIDWNSEPEELAA